MQINRGLISILILLAAGCMFFFLVVPKYRDFKKLQSDIGIAQAEYNAKYDYYAQINKAFGELEKRKTSLEKIDKALPDDLSLAPLVYFIQKKASENGMIIKDLFFTKASQPTATNPVREIGFSLNIIGTYSSFKNLLFSLEKSANLFEVTAVNFGNSSGQGATLGQTRSFTIEIKTHSY